MSQGDFRIVVIVASSGGIDALSHILSALPRRFPVAIAIVQHISLSSPTALAELLQQRTQMTVKNAVNGEGICRGMVYVAPPNFHLVVDASRHFALRDGAKVKHVRPSGDVLFESAAETFEEHVIALVLTGDDGDGSAGVSAVKRHGGTVISQSEETSEDASMPESAIATGAVDYILPLTSIGTALKDLVFARTKLAPLTISEESLLPKVPST